jgi:hypothetical protein
MNLFKPEDFIRYDGHDMSMREPLEHWQRAEAARKANEILNAYLETLPKVYGVMDGLVIRQAFTAGQATEDTHSARLIDIQPLEEKKVTITEKEFDEAFSQWGCGETKLNEFKNKLGF